MESAGHDASISALSWVPVNVGGSKLLGKAWFGDTEYRVLLSDLNSVWEEDMDTESIQSRAQDLNKRLRAPVQAFFAHLRSVAWPCLSGQLQDQSTVQFHLEHHGKHLTVRLKSELAGVPFHWDFRCTLAPVAVVSTQLVRPLLAVTRVLQKQVGELAALLVRKDAEILDYKENGAVLSRGRLQTEPFEEEMFRENFITQTLPQMSILQDSLEFDSELQELYVAVSTMRNTSKRKRLDEHSSAPVESFSFVPEHPVPEQDQHGIPSGSSPTHAQLNAKPMLVPMLAVDFWLDNYTDMKCASIVSEQSDTRQSLEEAQDADSEQTVPLLPATVAAASVDRLATRPKKKKAVGLFR